MKFRLLFAGLLIAASATSAMAVGPYIGASGGVTITHDSDVDVTDLGTLNASYKAGGGFNLSGGYNFSPVRLEAEFGYKSADLDRLSGPGGSADISSSDITVLSYMLNGYYDIKTGSPLTPFLGAGIGFLHGELEDQGDSFDDTVFGYQLTAGASYQAAKNVNLDLYYRFLGAASDFKQYDTSISYHSSNVFAGIRYNF